MTEHDGRLGNPTGGRGDLKRRRVWRRAIVKQHGRTADMAFSVPFLIRYISNIMTLNPGDLIATGTPAGVSPIKDGDVCEVEIAEVGILRNTVCNPST